MRKTRRWARNKSVYTFELLHCKLHPIHSKHDTRERSIAFLSWALSVAHRSSHTSLSPPQSQLISMPTTCCSTADFATSSNRSQFGGLCRRLLSGRRVFAVLALLRVRTQYNIKGVILGVAASLLDRRIRWSSGLNYDKSSTKSNRIDKRHAKWKYLSDLRFISLVSEICNVLSVFRKVNFLWQILWLYYISICGNKIEENLFVSKANRGIIFILNMNKFTVFSAAVLAVLLIQPCRAYLRKWNF